MPAHRNTSERGRAAEALVCRYLQEQGCRIVGRNVRVGRLELDIVAQKGPWLIVCEVRARRNTAFGHPAETVDRAKQQRLRRATGLWLAQQKLRGQVRFDVAAVVGIPPGEATLTYYENAF